MKDDLKIQISNSEDRSYRDFLVEKIKSFNNRTSPEHQNLRDTKNIEHFHVVVTTDKGQFVGGISASSYWQALEIDDLFIESDYRHRGIGTMLMEESIKFAKEHELKFIHFRAYTFQGPHFFERLGFKIVGEMKNFPGEESYYWMRYDIE